jgi:hypothetical protein
MRHVVFTLALGSLAACSSPHHAIEDASAPVDLLEGDQSESTTDAGLKACSPTSPCVATGFTCAYSIAQGCAATTGVCIPRPSGSSCGALRILCGCSGKETDGDGDCNYPVGYASAPTLSLGPCEAGDDGGDSVDGGG